jgi:enhancing lycopene biosynthesis protein 2
MKKVGVVLAGCGYLDGAEIHEAVLTLLALDKAKAEVCCIAPNIEQMHVVNHLTNQTTEEKRNVLVEAARIARSNIVDIKSVNPEELDALIFPGGFGAAKNLSDYAVKSAECTVNPDVSALVLEMLKAKKPIGAICIAPAVLAKILGNSGIKATLTIGTDTATANDIEKMGCRHKKSAVTEIVIDRKNKIVSTPAYMLGTRIAYVAKGIEKLVKEVLAMVKSGRK